MAPTAVNEKFSALLVTGPVGGAKNRHYYYMDFLCESSRIRPALPPSPSARLTVPTSGHDSFGHLTAPEHPHNRVRAYALSHGVAVEFLLPGRVDFGLFSFGYMFWKLIFILFYFTFVRPHVIVTVERSLLYFGLAVCWRPFSLVGLRGVDSGQET